MIHPKQSYDKNYHEKRNARHLILQEISKYAATIPGYTALKNNLLWREGKPIWMSLTGLTMTLASTHQTLLASISGSLLLFSFYFFRNPIRRCSNPINNNTLVCPSDGTVIDIQYNESGAFEGNYHYKISIFLSPFDVHVNWIPIAGTIEKITYYPGTFTPAFLPKSSHLNEHNDLVLKTNDGTSILIRQIAGTIARRICCWANEQETVYTGQKYGMIRFGSRMEIFLPAHTVIEIKKGQRVFGNQTILGKLLPRS